MSGTVQGVFFRESCRRRAVEHRVNGWVRNLPDGDVEAVFEGEPADVESMIAWVQHGPPSAAVDRVRTSREDPEGLSGFSVRR